MSQNIFEELQGKKQKLIALAQKAAEYSWIPQHNSPLGEKGSEIISYDEIIEKLEKDTLTIGVIGQMKCGKSTFLNSFVFEDNILPAATTPMTAALSVITYGEKERIVAEFYTKDEWAEQKQQASRQLDEVTDSLDESKVKAANELVSKAAKLGNSLESLLGKTQEDCFSNLIEYVGADGKFVSITKSVTIYYPKEYLKGVEIVDTPGFNDPIVSREERTKEFLKKADVVLMMLYAGRPFDSTDRDIIFKNVRQCGIGKVLVGINKYDIPYCSETNPEDEAQIKEYVKAEIRKACRDCNDNTLVEILSEVEPIPLSAEMALLSELPMSKISSIESFDFAWKRHCTNFGISTQREMREWSHLDNLVNAVKAMINKEKDKILFTKPLNAIIAAGNKVRADADKELTIIENHIKLLTMPDSGIEEQEHKVSTAKRRLSKKIDALGEDIDTDVLNIVRKGKNELEDIVDKACRNLTHVIENEWGRLKSFDSIKPRCNNILIQLHTRNLKRATENIEDEGKKKIQNSIRDFFNDADSLLMRCLPELDAQDLLKSIKNKIHMETGSNDLFKFDNSEDTQKGFGLGKFFDKFLTWSTLGGSAIAKNVFTHDEAKQNALSWVNSIKAEFDPDPYLQPALSSKDKIISDVKQEIITELIEPLQEQIQEIKSEKSNKEKKLCEAREKHNVLENRKKTIASQFIEINNLKDGI